MSATIIHSDGLQWCSDNPDTGSVVTSVPDPQNALGDSHDDPWEFFDDCIRAAVRATAPDAPVVFRQTDRRSNGTISKAKRVFDVLDEYPQYRLLWHKIALQRDVGSMDLFRPTYAHVLAFGPDGVGPGERTPDVIQGGKKLYDDGIGFNTTETALAFAGQHSGTIVDPFCGRGTIPVMADALGYTAIGVDLDPEQVEYARTLTLTPP